jgi:hypothetical protein
MKINYIVYAIISDNEITNRKEVFYITSPCYYTGNYYETKNGNIIYKVSLPFEYEEDSFKFLYPNDKLNIQEVPNVFETYEEAIQYKNNLNYASSMCTTINKKDKAKEAISRHVDYFNDSLKDYEQIETFIYDHFEENFQLTTYYKS